LIFDPENFFFLAVSTAGGIGCAQIGQLNHFQEEQLPAVFCSPRITETGGERQHGLQIVVARSV
jgi:hypothetical protein